MNPEDKVKGWGSWDLDDRVAKLDVGDSMKDLQKALHEKLAEAHKQMFQSFHAGHSAGFSMMYVDEIAALEEKSVLEQSALGQNLHQLLEEKKHPLTDTALEYIRELEEKLARRDNRITELEAELEKWNKKKHPIQRELRDLKNKLNHHPAMKRR